MFQGQSALAVFHIDPVFDTAAVTVAALWECFPNPTNTAFQCFDAVAGMTVLYGIHKVIGQHRGPEASRFKPMDKIVEQGIEVVSGH